MQSGGTICVQIRENSFLRFVPFVFFEEQHVMEITEAQFGSREPVVRCFLERTTLTMQIKLIKLYCFLVFVDSGFCVDIIK